MQSLFSPMSFSSPASPPERPLAGAFADPSADPSAKPSAVPPIGPPIGPDAPWLAPLAGFSDLPFRLLCREQGAAAACTEMISAKGLIYGLGRRKGTSNGTEELLTTVPEDAPLVVQLFGEDPEYVGLAARELRARGFAFFDLNLGCSVPKVTKTGAGAALLREPERALAVARALFKEAGEGRAGCKLRLGWDAATPVCLDLARRLEDAGAAWITLHPRYARQGFGGAPDHAAFERLAAALRIPLIASGDIFSAADGARCLERGAAGVMFARGAMGNPAVFKQYLALRAGAPLPDRLPADELQALILRHAALAKAWTPGRPGRSGRTPALLKMRTFVPRYVRHLSGVKGLRQALARCESWEELSGILHSFFSHHPGSGAPASPDSTARME